MIEAETVAAFNARHTVNMNNIKTMTPAQLDAVKAWGSGAENLLRNRDFAQAIHEFKFDMCDALTEIKTHTPEDNAHRVAVSNQIAGIDLFVAQLQRAVFMKNRVVTQQSAPNE